MCRFCLHDYDFLGIFLQKCLMELLCGKTVVYATHQLEFLDASDLVLVSSQ